MTTTTWLRLSALPGEQRLVLAAIYWGGWTETELARELNDLLGDRLYDRDAIHSIRLKAERRLRRRAGGGRR